MIKNFVRLLERPIMTRLFSARMDSTVRDDECPGLSSEKVTCNCDVCPDVGAWSPWGKYSDCPVSCDGAKHTRLAVRKDLSLIVLPFIFSIF